MTTPFPPPGAQNPLPPIPPPPPPRRGLAWLWVALGAAAAVIVLCGLGAVVLFTGIRSEIGGQAGAGDQPSPRVSRATMGQPVIDGKFEFVVDSVECGVEQVGTDFLVERAQGQFCLMTLSVKNIGTEPQTLFDRDQKGFGTNGSEYGANSAAGISANDTDSQVWVTQINPGNKLTGVVVYDLPPGVELAQVELHDSTTSEGVTVDLK